MSLDGKWLTVVSLDGKWLITKKRPWGWIWTLWNFNNFYLWCVGDATPWMVGPGLWIWNLHWYRLAKLFVFLYSLSLKVNVVKMNWLHTLVISLITRIPKINNCLRFSFFLCPSQLSTNTRRTSSLRRSWRKSLGPAMKCFKQARAITETWAFESWRGGLLFAICQSGAESGSNDEVTFFFCGSTWYIVSS